MANSLHAFRTLHQSKEYYYCLLFQLILSFYITIQVNGLFSTLLTKIKCKFLIQPLKCHFNNHINFSDFSNFVRLNCKNIIDPRF